MFIKNWQIDFKESWKNGTPLSKVWVREKRKPSFWLLLLLALLTILFALSETPNDPWPQILRAHGWMKSDSPLCRNLKPGEFGEVESPETDAEIYLALDGAVLVSKRLTEVPTEICRKILEPSYVEEI